MSEQIPHKVTQQVKIYSLTEPDEQMKKLAACLVEASNQFHEENRAKGGASPMEFLAWDAAAWKRLEAQTGPCTCNEFNPPADYFNDGPKQNCLCNWMLMHHESDSVAAFKNRSTRKYRRV